MIFIKPTRMYIKKSIKKGQLEEFDGKLLQDAGSIQ